jgi:hypothetical protein
MKKLLVLTMVLVSFVSYGQEFIITTDGLKDKNSIEKTFVVINVEGKTAKQLYDNAILYVNTTYKNPSAVMRGNVNDEFLSFTTHTSTFYMDSYIKRNISVDYITSLTFKDGKVKYEIQELEMVCNETRPQISLHLSGGMLQYSIYNNSGKLKKEDTKKDLESHFNYNIIAIKKYLEGKSSATKKDDF